MSYLIRAFEPVMLEEVADVRRQVFGGTLSFNRAYLAWKYLENPYLSEPILHVAQRDGAIVGIRGWFGTSWHMPHSPNPEIIPCAAESAVLKHERDRGIYEELTHFALDDLHERGFPRVINMSATPANYVSSIMTMGWKRVGHYKPLIWSHPDNDDAGGFGSASKPESSSPEGLSRLKESTRRTLDRFRPSSNSNPFREIEENLRNTDDGIRCGSVPEADVMTRLAAASEDGERIHQVRDETYFRWRYRDPRSNYRFLYAAGSHPSAFCVLSSRRTGAITLVDWAGSSSGVATLVTAAISGPARFTVRTWGIGMPQDLSQRLGDVGFRSDPAERRRGLLVRSTSETNEAISGGPSPLLDIDIWDLRMIFSDRH